MRRHEPSGKGGAVRRGRHPGRHQLPARGDLVGGVRPGRAPAADGGHPPGDRHGPGPDARQAAARPTGTRTPTRMCARRTAPCTPRTGPGCGRCRARPTCCGRASTAGWRWCWPARPMSPSSMRCVPPWTPRTRSTRPPSPGMSSPASPPRTWWRRRWTGSACRPQEAVFTGDTVWDVQACRKAGVPCIGLLSGGISRDELTAAGTAEVYRGPADLLAALRGSLLGGASGR